MAVRALVDRKIYYTPTGMTIDLIKGDVYDGDLGVYLANNASTLVEVIPPPVVEAPPEPAGAKAPEADDDEPEAGPGPAKLDGEPEASGPPDGATVADPSSDIGTGSGSTDTREPAQVATDFDPAEHNTAQVLAYVREHPETQAAVRAAEEAGKQRTGVLNGLA